MNWIRRNPFLVLLVPLVVWIIYTTPEHSPWQEKRTTSGEVWQERLMARYQELGVKERELATISALTLGYRGKLSKEVKQQFVAAGAMHVLAVSGLHTGILMVVLINLLTFCHLKHPLWEERKKRWFMGSVVIAALVAYAWLTGGSPSVVRSVIMCSFVMLAIMLRRRNQMLNAVFAAAWLILLVRPKDLFSVSFQLSFAAVVAIALFAPGWKRAMGNSYLAGMVGMTIAAMVGTMPVSLYYFGQLSNYFMLSNLIVLPLAWAMMVGGLLTLTIGWITPLGKLLAWCVNGVTWLMNESVGWIESLPYSTTQVALPLWGMWVLVAVNLGILLVWNKVTQYVDRDI